VTAHLHAAFDPKTYRLHTATGATYHVIATTDQGAREAGVMLENQFKRRIGHPENTTQNDITAIAIGIAYKYNSKWQITGYALNVKIDKEWN
jgi:hypothetical protein